METVRDLRLAADLTQIELARRSGIAQPNIAAYETGKRQPSPTTMSRIRAAAKPRPSGVLAKHRDAILALARRHKADRVRVFGSIARGEDVSGSDIDLLVRFVSGADLVDMAELMLDIEELTGIHVDLVSEGGLPAGPHPIRDEARPL
ncbi:XRE family transcriptional regulator [Nocardia camponoti]|uniref:HTH cro/C1-type domain-containing protein n=1 Tax=Nocardia camponoti TaxID=1616106 RepID=A0A917V8H4_9NOCA|nr:XRE family transcriptional regulator [Nocardia camponoti]GGK51363.1 hypothetical protein GCM10011591_23710 [Nocardia camponoti]